MKNKKQQQLDLLRSENAEIKNRLKNDFGMIEYSSGLPPEIENQWLKSIEAFEKAAREQRREELRQSLTMN